MAFSDYMAIGLQSYMDFALPTDMPPSPAGGLFIALHTADPTALCDQGELVDPTFGAYARAPIELGPTAGATSQDIWNISPVIFPAATNTVATPITHYSIWDLQVAGNPLCYGVLDASTAWTTGVQIAIQTNLLRIALPTVPLTGCVPVP